MAEERRRSTDFIERLSVMLVVGGFFGGFLVLLDLRLTLTLWEQVIKIGAEGFSAELKGVVIQSMMISGVGAVVMFWLSTTKQGQDQAQAVSRMAEAPVVAAALAAPAVTPAPATPDGVIPAAAVVAPSTNGKVTP